MKAKSLAASRAVDKIDRAAAALPGAPSTTDNALWQSWAERLRHLGMQTWVASLLGASGSLMTVAAQALYLSEPILSIAFPPHHSRALANLLEDPNQRRQFANLLMEETR